MSWLWVVCRPCFVIGNDTGWICRDVVESTCWQVSRSSIAQVECWFTQYARHSTPESPCWYLSVVFILCRSLSAVLCPHTDLVQQVLISMPHLSEFSIPMLIFVRILIFSIDASSLFAVAVFTLSSVGAGIAMCFFGVAFGFTCVAYRFIDVMRYAGTVWHSFCTVGTVLHRYCMVGYVLHHWCMAVYILHCCCMACNVLNCRCMLRCTQWQQQRTRAAVPDRCHPRSRERAGQTSIPHGAADVSRSVTRVHTIFLTRSGLSGVHCHDTVSDPNAIIPCCERVDCALFCHGFFFDAVRMVASKWFNTTRVPLCAIANMHRCEIWETYYAKNLLYNAIQKQSIPSASKVHHICVW